MANTRAAEVVFIGGWCSEPLALELRKILSKKKLGVSEAIERWAEAVVREDYAERGKPLPARIEQALTVRRQRKASTPWLAKPKKSKNAKPPSSL